MILLWKTKQDFGREEGDVSRLMTCFIGMKNVFSAAWDRPASWLGCERLMVRERMSNLQTVATSRAHHVGVFSQFCHLFPRRPLKHSLPPTYCLTHASIPAYFSCLNSKDSYIPCRKPDRRKWETPGLQIWAQSGICPSRCSSTGFSVRNIRGRRIISDTFPKEVVAFTW